MHFPTGYIHTRKKFNCQNEYTKKTSIILFVTGFITFTVTYIVHTTTKQVHIYYTWQKWQPFSKYSTANPSHWKSIFAKWYTLYEFHFNLYLIDNYCSSEITIIVKLCNIIMVMLNAINILSSICKILYSFETIVQNKRQLIFKRTRTILKNAALPTQ